jgi:hypothetical protein
MGKKPRFWGFFNGKFCDIMVAGPKLTAGKERLCQGIQMSAEKGKAEKRAVL